MIKKIFTPKTALLIIVADLVLLALLPWKYFQKTNGYCSEDLRAGGPAPLMICEYTLSPLGKIVLTFFILALVTFVIYLLGIGLKKLIHLVTRK